MDVIKTPTAVADKFGAGLNGFRSESPGLPATQISPEWADSVQMEIVNVIISQGIALDDLVFNQMATAIGSYSFANPKVTGSLSIKGGAMLFVENLGTLEMLSGSGLIIGNGSTLAVQANVTLSASDNTWTWGSSNTNDWTINGNVTLGTDASSVVSLVGDVGIGFDATSAATLNGALSGAVGSSIDAPTITGTSIAPLVLAFQSSGTTLPATAGSIRWNDTFVSIRDNAGQIHTLSEPRRGFDLTFTTGGAMADTTAEAGRRIKQNEDVWITIGARVAVDLASQDVAYQVRVTGPLGTADIFTSGIRSPAVANTGATVSDGFKWKPTDSFAELTTQNYTFRVRMGVSGGNVTADRVRITVESAVQT